MSRLLKQTGIEWIGAIPDNWEVKRVKNGFLRKKGEAHQEEPVVLSLARSGVRVRDLSNNEGQIAASYYNYNPVVPGDLLLNPMDLYSGANCSISKVAGVISPAYINLKAKDGYNPLYYDYYFKTQYWAMAMFAHGKGVSFDNRWTLGAEDLMRYYIPVPPIDEQNKIADYLEQECGKVDEVISKTTIAIEEYKKLKQAVITDAVTKGIKEKTEYKDSGVEWIGKMPSKWNIVPFRYVLKERNEKNSPVKSTERLSLSIDLGITPYSEKTTNLDRFKDDFEQYKLAHKGDLVMNSMNMIVGASGVSDYFGCVSPVYYTFYDETDDHVTAKFCEYIFRSKPMLRVLFSLGKGIYAIVRGDDRVNTCRLKVSKEDLKSTKIPVPPIDEQREIIGYLNRMCNEIDAVIRKKESFIEEMENYRRSIIYEYVTGKKEVPACY